MSFEEVAVANTKSLLEAYQAFDNVESFLRDEDVRVAICSNTHPDPQSLCFSTDIDGVGFRAEKPIQIESWTSLFIHGP